MQTPWLKLCNGEQREILMWLAGLLEGEGWFTNQQGKPHMGVAMRDEDIIRRVHALTGCGHVNRYTFRERPMWQWQCTRSRDALALAYALFTMMGDRRRSQITFMVRAWINRPVRQLLPCGTEAAYVRGCRCDECKEAYRAKNRERAVLYRENKKFGTGPGLGWRKGKTGHYLNNIGATGLSDVEQR